MPELAETQLENPAPAAEPVARIEDDEDEDSDDTIPELEDAGTYEICAHFVVSNIFRVFKRYESDSCIVVCY